MKLSNEDLLSRSRVILDEFGLSDVRLMPFDKGVINENIFVQSNEGRFVLKRYLQKPVDVVNREVGVLEILASKNFISPRVLKNLKQESIIDVLGYPGLLYEFIEGETNISPDQEMLSKIGSRLAEMHELLKNIPFEKDQQKWDPIPLSVLINEKGKELQQRKFPRADYILLLLETELPKYSFPENLPIGFTHQDVKPENIVIMNDELVGILDFDNSYTGAFLFDIATTIIWSCFDGFDLNNKKVDALIEGYSSIRKLTGDEESFLLDAIRWRLLREVFIGPFVTKDFPELSIERADYFMSLYHRLSV